MNTTRTLTTIAAATTLIGAIGFAYAQTTAPAPTGGPSEAEQTQKMPTADQPVPMKNSMTPMPAPASTSTTTNGSAPAVILDGAPTRSTPSADGNSMPVERAPKADRG